MTSERVCAAYFNDLKLLIRSNFCCSNFQMLYELVVSKHRIKFTQVPMAFLAFICMYIVIGVADYYIYCVWHSIKVRIRTLVFVGRVTGAGVIDTDDTSLTFTNVVWIEGGVICRENLNG